MSTSQVTSQFVRPNNMAETENRSLISSIRTAIPMNLVISATLLARPLQRHISVSTQYWNWSKRSRERPGLAVVNSGGRSYPIMKRSISDWQKRVPHSSQFVSQQTFGAHHRAQLVIHRCTFAHTLRRTEEELLLQLQSSGLRQQLQCVPSPEESTLTARPLTPPPSLLPHPGYTLASADIIIPYRGTAGVLRFTAVWSGRKT